MSKNKSLKHIALIPDANRRWAAAKSLKPWEGHREGKKRFVEVAEHAFDMGVDHLTFWAASENNLRERSKKEVSVLNDLAKEFLREELEERKFIDRQTGIRVIGKWDEILQDDKLRELVEKIESESSGFTEKTLTFLFGYNGTTEMLETVNKLRSSTDRIGEKDLRNALWTGFLPDVDLVVRTGGEPHWSVGFLMWLTANSQFYFTEKFWPDFIPKDLEKAVDEYKNRGRRFGR